jgi:hypothetical protein
MSSVSHFEISYLRPYPTFEGERSCRAAYSREEAEKIKDIYSSMGAVDVKIKPIGKEYQYPA